MGSIAKFLISEPHWTDSPLLLFFSQGNKRKILSK